MITNRRARGLQNQVGELVSASTARNRDDLGAKTEATSPCRASAVPRCEFELVGEGADEHSGPRPETRRRPGQQHAKAAPALAAPTTRGRRSRTGAATDQNPACQKHRQPPPEKTTASYRSARVLSSFVSTTGIGIAFHRARRATAKHPTEYHARRGEDVDFYSVIQWLCTGFTARRPRGAYNPTMICASCSPDGAFYTMLVGLVTR